MTIVFNDKAEAASREVWSGFEADLESAISLPNDRRWPIVGPRYEACLGRSKELGCRVSEAVGFPFGLPDTSVRDMAKHHQRMSMLDRMCPGIMAAAASGNLMLTFAKVKTLATNSNIRNVSDELRGLLKSSCFQW